MYNNLGKLERYRLVTIRGGGTDWHPSPHFQWVIFRIPGWHWIVGVLLSAEGVILPAKGVPLSGHLEFPGCTVLQVSYWSPVPSFLTAGDVFLLGHLGFLAICQS